MKKRIAITALLLVVFSQGTVAQLISKQDWEPDILEGFESRTLLFTDDYDGEVISTLIRKKAPVTTNKSVIYIHGFIDYFFQEELANAYVDAGYNFYALDLRKHGRSLLSHQHPNFMLSVSEFYEDIDAAVDIIKNEDGNQKLLLNAHSTGGLISALYMEDRSISNPFDAVIYNSPFFDINDGLINVNERLFIPHIVEEIASDNPFGETGMKLAEQYGQSLHYSERGEWVYDTELKPIQGFPIYWGWLNGIMEAQQRLQAGLHLDLPIMVLYSRTSTAPVANNWDDVYQTTEIVLDVTDINRFSDVIGYHVSEVQIEDGLHDLVLSRQDVRQRVLDEMLIWSNAYMQ